MNTTLWIPGVMPGMNEIIAACERSPYTYAKMKKKYGQDVALRALSQQFKIPGPAHFTIECVEPDRRRDKDNVLAGALKITFDALRHAGLLENDGWAHVLSIIPHFSVDRDKPGVRFSYRI